MDKLRQAERYLKFNVKELKAVAAKAINRVERDIVSIRKLAEGGYNRTFTITMQDGLELIARMPYPITVPKKYAIASEVATMNFVRSHGVPVPRIYDYSATSQNCVGAEYMIMEKVGGTVLQQSWYSMTSNERYKIIEQIVQMEATLFSINLPASGSIYYKKDLDASVKTVDVSAPDDRTEYCIGPNAGIWWWYEERANLDLDRGPYTDARDIMRAVGKRELAWASQFAQPRYPSEGILREFFNFEKVPPDDHINALNDYLRISDHLVPSEARLNRFILRHPDLQPNNLFVSDSMDLLGVIDWQHSSILPIFLHCGLPNDFQNYGDKDSIQLKTPQLPQNFSELSAEEQEAATDLLRRRELHFLYNGFTYELNKDHSDALSDPYGLLRKRLFHRAATPWNGNSVYLKADIIQVIKLWKKITASQDENAADCPIHYSEAEAKECFRLLSELQEAAADLDKAREHLGMDYQGCVFPNYYDAIKARCQEIKKEALEEAETDLERDALLNHFPFDDHDETGMT
ncbi:MAG: hypothetical protein Q9209_006460 [Squamulea sp. 1 TL-2023]